MLACGAVSKPKRGGAPPRDPDSGKNLPHDPNTRAAEASPASIAPADVDWLKKQRPSLGLVVLIVAGVVAVVGGAFTVVLGVIWLKIGELEKGVYGHNADLASIKTDIGSTKDAMRDLKAEMNQIAPRSLQLPPAPGSAVPPSTKAPARQ
jgi:hypothetical protein